MFRNPDVHVKRFAGERGLRSELVATRSVADGALLIFELRDNRGEREWCALLTWRGSDRWELYERDAGAIAG